MLVESGLFGTSLADNDERAELMSATNITITSSGTCKIREF
jgi:hypothetical protein